MESKWRYAGVITVLGASLGAAAGLLAGQLDRVLAVGIALVGILMGSAIARGGFQSDPRLVPDPGPRPTTNDQPPISGKE
jgi:predicted lysophospholipase L1 biosynthesis ABC-type transport system permease subunit